MNEKLLSIFDAQTAILRWLESLWTSGLLRSGEKLMPEESEKLDGTKVQTVRRDDGSEYVRELYTCSICGARSNRPFPKSAISCLRPDCGMPRR